MKNPMKPYSMLLAKLGGATAVAVLPACMDLGRYHAQTEVRAPSCVDKGSRTCQGVSCCASITMSGGTYPMGRGILSSDSDYYPNASLIDDTPEHSATVSAFQLDKFEVTVGRFRAFLADYDRWHKIDGNPKDNAGMHAHARNTGWGRSWIDSSSDLPADAAALENELLCIDGNWSDQNGNVEAENYPINCVTWFEAFAFCVWDGGRLPTEAEWEFAAAGGAENRLFPWGTEEPDTSRANFWDSDATPKLPVGSKLKEGAGYFGHADLAGSMFEWVLDWSMDRYYGPIGEPKDCVNCASDVADPELADAPMRVRRGGSWHSYAHAIRSAARSYGEPKSPTFPNTMGFRCARDIK